MEPYGVGIWRHMSLQGEQGYVATDKPLRCLAASKPRELCSVCNSIVISLSHVSVYKLPSSGPLPGLYFSPLRHNQSFRSFPELALISTVARFCWIVCLSFSLRAAAVPTPGLTGLKAGGYQGSIWSHLPKMYPSQTNRVV